VLGIFDIRTSLRPDYYESFPNFSHEELAWRLEVLPFHRATLLVPGNMLRAAEVADAVWRQWRLEYERNDLTHKLTQLREVLEHVGIAPQVARAVGSIPRHRFVRPDLERVSYLNATLAFDSLSSVTPPGLVALMLEAAGEGHLQIFEAGVGAGYHAACALALYGTGATLVGVELDETYAAFGQRAVRELGLEGRLQIHVGDAWRFEPEEELDLVYMTASADQPFALPAVQRLRIGGTLQVIRPLSWDEFQSEPPGSWLVSRFSSYEKYLSDDWREYACVETLQRSGDGRAFVVCSRLYDVCFVPVEHEGARAKRSPFTSDVAKELLARMGDLS
jgi:protein-L-isoaspartate(D-aspartate) O-methyltransferase